MDGARARPGTLAPLDDARGSGKLAAGLLERRDAGRPEDCADSALTARFRAASLHAALGDYDPGEQNEPLLGPSRFLGLFNANMEAGGPEQGRSQGGVIRGGLVTTP